jgi:hypothetical protein
MYVYDIEGKKKSKQASAVVKSEQTRKMQRYDNAFAEERTEKKISGER